MPKKIFTYFYLSLIFSIIGLFFPTHISQPIGFDIGDFVHWVFGFYIFIPRNPVGELKFYFTLSIQGFFLITSTSILLVIFFTEIKNCKIGEQYNKNRVLISALLLILAILFYDTTSGLIFIRISSWAFIYSAIFALIGNKKLIKQYLDEGINIRKKSDIIFGIILLTLSIYGLINSLFIIFYSIILYEINLFYITSQILPGLSLLCILLTFGIDLLKKD